MLPSTPKGRGGECNPALFAAAACKRCRLKKLKCDSSPQKCKHCSRAGTPCLIVDAASKREYERGYVANLCKEIAYYEDQLHKSTTEKEPSQDPAPATLVQPNEQLHGSELPIRIGDAGSSRQNEGGSITSIAKLVAAAVTNKARGTYLMNLGNAVSEEQNQLDQCRLKMADYPTPEAAHNLLDTYLNDPHILHPFLNRAQITDVFRCQASGTSLSNKDLFRFFMVCAIGALYLNRTGQHTAPAIDYYTAAMQYEGDALDTTGVELAQNILLLVVFTGQHWMGIGNKWELTRLAIRICTASDLHKRPPRNISLMEQQMRKRVFWSAYINERHASSNLGTPMAIQETDITTDLPIDADDDLIDSSETELQQYRGLSEVAVQIRHIKIRQITSRIQAISRKRNIDFPSDKRALNDIINELDEWKNSIYISPEGENPYNSVQWIHLNYYKEKLSCYKIMVIPPQGQKTMFHLSTLDEIRCCLESAAEIPYCYRDLPWGEWRMMNWTCVQDLLSSGFIMLYCLHVIHELSQLSDSDPNHIVVTTRDPWFQKTFDSLYCCNSILSRISQHWRTVRNQQRIFEILTTTTYQLLTSIRNEGPVPSISESNDAFGPSQLPPLENNYYSMMNFSMINTDQADLDLDIDLNGVDFDGLDWEQILSFPNTFPGTRIMDTERTRT